MAANQQSEETREAAREAREAARQSTAQAERVSRATAEINDQAARAGAKILGRNMEVAQQVFMSGAEMAAKLTQHSAHQFGRVLGFGGDGAETTVSTYSKNLNAILESSATLADMTKDITQEWINFGRERVERNFAQMDHLLRSRTPQDFLASNSELMKENLQGFVGCARRLAEQSMRATESVAQELRQVVE